jgi:transcriptional regulator of arginine metabolism
MARTFRQSKILDLISRKEIETQEELVEELRAAKVEVTQATVSRDIKELGLIKVMSDATRKYHYSLERTGDAALSAKMTNMFRESVISIANAANLVVVKTLSGSANAAGSVIDKLGIESVLGCIAGDDTVLIILSSEEKAADVISILNDLIN